jgi:CheY-like chemotaxis protein
MATQSPAGADIVLIADDNAPLRSKIVDFLTLEGIRSVEAGDGEAALREAARVHPAVVLLDIKMPTMDGLTAARRIVDMPWQPKVILMSGFDDSVRLANKADLPVFAVLEKPVPLRLLARFVWDALEKSGPAN